MMRKIQCAFCGKYFDRQEITYVEGKPFCQKHYTEAEMMTVEEKYEDEEGELDEENDKDEKIKHS